MMDSIPQWTPFSFYTWVIFSDVFISLPCGRLNSHKVCTLAVLVQSLNKGRATLMILHREWPETAPDIRSGLISGFLELFASANIQENTPANTCAYLALIRLGVSSITSLEPTIIDETTPTSHTVLFKPLGVLMRPGFYYLVGLTIISPNLKYGN